MSRIKSDLVFSRETSNTIIIIPKQTPEEIVQKARQKFKKGYTKNVQFRKQQLNALLRCVEENEELFLEAVYKDLRKPPMETDIMELQIIINEINHFLWNINEYVKPDTPKKYLFNFLDEVYVLKDPYGVVLVMGAWNYPLSLVLVPVIGAIAAGNCVVIKPSDLAPASALLLFQLIPKYLDNECYPVYLGGVTETTALLEQRFDYIFYTGGFEVAQIIHRAANKHLTPVTLELGGKNPTYLDSSADLEKSSKRILWGKFSNAGQTCIAPDYLLCTEEVQKKFLEYVGKHLKEFYGDNPKCSDSLGRIVNERHFNRLIGLLKDVKIAIGGKFDPNERYIEPTIVVNVKPNHPLMQQEIFGPILPIILINDVNDAINIINEIEKPLSMYIFSNKKKDIKSLMSMTSCGGITINDTMLHFPCQSLAFGGVGHSGIGAYTGKASFYTFTHEKGVLHKNFSYLANKGLTTRYPPYSGKKRILAVLLSRARKDFTPKFLGDFCIFLLGITVTVTIYYLFNLLQ